MYTASALIGIALGIVYGLWVSADLPRVFHFKQSFFTRFLRFFSIILIFTYILHQPQLHSILILVVFIVSVWFTVLTRIKVRSNGTS